MVLTVRHRGVLLDVRGEEQIDDVVAAMWFDPDEEGGLWGGVVEPSLAGPLLRGQVSAGQTRYWLRLGDGREGPVHLSLSQLEADGVHPLVAMGLAPLRRPGKP